MIERRQLHIDGLCLSYLEQGRAAKDSPSLVLLHGLMACADTFVPLMREFDPDFHVIALDFPGAGHSERREDIDASLPNMAKLVGRVVGMLALEKPIIVGHSHGGAVAMTFAAHRRDGLHALVLLAPAHPYSDESDLLIRFYLSVAGRLLAHMIPWFPKWIQIMALRRMEGPESHGTRERLRPYRENLRTPGTVRHLLRLLRTWHLDMSDLRRALRRPLDTPILILWGDFDRVVPHSTAAKLRAHLPQSELITLQGIGHLAAEESPRLVAGCVHAWVKREVAAQFSPNSVATHSLMTPPITPSFDSGE